jgi:hypothetical protein
MTASILAALLLLAPVVTESGRFVIKQNGKTIGTEEFSIRMKDKGYLVEGRTRLDGDPTPLTSRMELDENLIPTTYEYSRGAKGSIRVKVDTKSSSELVITENGKADSDTNFYYPPGASIVDNNFFHHYLLLLYRVKSAEQSLAIFVPQDMQVGLAKVKSTGKNTYALDVGAVKIEATVDEQGRLLRLAVPEAKVVVER